MWVICANGKSSNLPLLVMIFKKLSFVAGVLLISLIVSVAMSHFMAIK